MWILISLFVEALRDCIAPSLTIHIATYKMGFVQQLVDNLWKKDYIHITELYTLGIKTNIGITFKYSF